MCRLRVFVCVCVWALNAACVAKRARDNGAWLNSRIGVATLAQVYAAIKFDADFFQVYCNASYIHVVVYYTNARIHALEYLYNTDVSTMIYVIP